MVGSIPVKTLLISRCQLEGLSQGSQTSIFSTLPLIVIVVVVVVVASVGVGGVSGRC